MSETPAGTTVHRLRGVHAVHPLGEFGRTVKTVLGGGVTAFMDQKRDRRKL